MNGQRRRRWAVLPALLAMLALPACSIVVVGQASPAQPPVTDVGGGELTVVGATDDAVDILARNALADLEDFWTEQLPEVFGQQWSPLEGGYFSVDPGNVDPAVYPDGIGCGSDPSEVEDNAFYCLDPSAPHSDSISYDRTFLAELGEEFGRFIPALVMSHEFGHAVQARVGSPGASILAETQADCLAGTWTRWVADGQAEHSTLRTPELDELLRGYLLLRDPVGTDINAQEAHGSYFDRVSAFQEGFDSGAEACRDNFGVDRVLTQNEFSPGEQFTGGNASYPDLLDIVDRSLPEAFGPAFDQVFGEPFDAPEIEPFDGEAPGCATDPDQDLVYCADDRVVGFDETDLAPDAYELGDFALATAIALPYGLAVRDQLGLSTDDQDAVRSAVCLSGWYAFQVYDQQTSVGISPGDVDESVQFLLTFGDDPSVVPAVGLTGFQLVDLFRNGFVEGLPACDVGA